MTPFGTTADGRPVHRVEIGAGDLSVSILTYGAIVQDLRLAGLGYPLTLGAERVSDYQEVLYYHGAIVGPVANRIGGARVRIGGMMYELERNENGRTHLHSGSDGLHTRVWTVAARTEASVTLTCILPDGACGLPGNRKITAMYTVLSPGTLQLELHGTTDTPSPLNIVNHSYWNLDGSETWAGHRLRIAAETFLPLDADILPTGEVAPVAGTDLDFRNSREIMPSAPPLDHNFCLSDIRTPMRDVLWLSGRSGVRMTVGTTMPGLQVYDGRVPARPGKQSFEGLAIEAQLWPDAPNHAGFPSFMAGPETPFRQSTRWRFDRP